MVLVGNVMCVFVCIIETFAMSGLWLAWGQITAIFKEQGLFASYCDINENGTTTDCDRRDLLFNNVYTATNVISGVSALLMGIVQGYSYDQTL